MSTVYTWLLRCLVLLGALSAICSVGSAQYSNSVFDLKKASELYDERGFLQGKSQTIDGKLSVSDANGNVSYIYPVSQFSIDGNKFQTTLNYCGSVAFTAFNNYILAHGSTNPEEIYTTPYRGWSKFQQNRPLWLIGVNGFAVQALSSNSHFHCDPALTTKAITAHNFDDADFTWAIDGYDFCNRMLDFGAKGAGSTIGSAYVDNIRLLRSDGSLLELMNINPVSITPYAAADARPELYTGYYVEQSANARGFAFVEYDTTMWAPYIQDAVSNQPANARCALVPRKVHYFPGDGLEYIFREWVIPFGMNAYKDLESRSGGLFGGPTIFYLDEIKSNTGSLVLFNRSRHYPESHALFSGLNGDTTRGRALMLSFAGHEIAYSGNSLTISAFGRTTQVIFNSVLPSGGATTRNWMPLGTNGYVMSPAVDIANMAETNTLLYESYLGYVTEIIDPEHRSTKFTYEPYTRVYEDFGFPRDNDGQTVRMTLPNLRLKEVTEPSARYRISYYSGGAVRDAGDTVTIAANSPTSWDLPRLSNVAGLVKKYDRAGQFLTSSQYDFFYESNSTFAERGKVTIKDEIKNELTSSEFWYRRYTLPNLTPYLPTPYYTALWKAQHTAGDVVTTTVTDYSSSTTPTTISAWGSSYPIQTPKWGTPYLILDTAIATDVNGVRKSYTTTSYQVDTVRSFGNNGVLAGLFGKDLIRKVASTRNAGTGAVLYNDSIDYVHFGFADTVVTRVDTVLNKFAMIEKFQDMRSQGLIDLNMKWEEAMYLPSILEFRLDTAKGRVKVPPLYGQEASSIVTGANGMIHSGRYNEYQNKAYDDIEFPFYNRGALLRDSVVGEGAARKIQHGSYSYLGKLLFGVADALGAATLYQPNYGVPTLRNPDGTWNDVNGSVKDNYNQVTSTKLRGAVFGNITEEPLAVQRYVRGYPAANQPLTTSDLTEFYERTYYGQVSGSLDANGWYSKYLWDKAGRLKTAWYPYDFPTSDNVFEEDVEGYDSTESYGLTNYIIVQDTVRCDGTVQMYPPTMLPQTRYGELYVDYPVIAKPVCPECESTGKKEEPTILALCTSPRPFFDQTPAIGQLTFNAKPEGVASIVSLDSAYIKLLITSVMGECVTLDVTIPDMNYSKTFTAINCPDAPGGGGGGTIGQRTKRSGQNEIQSGDASGIHDGIVKIDLASIAGDLIALGDQSFTVKLSTPTAGARIQFASGIDQDDSRPRLILKGVFHKKNVTEDYTLKYTYEDDSLITEVSSKVDDIRHSSNILDRTALGGSFRQTETRNFLGADYRLNRTEVTIGNPRSPLRVDSVINSYTGDGEMTRQKDQEGDTVVTRRDASGRPVEIVHQDGTRSTIEYQTGIPSGLGIAGQEFYGFATRKRMTNEVGTQNDEYYDAFDRLRREVQDAGGLNLTTKYDYDELGRLTSVTSPSGQTTIYAYDDFGRVKYKAHPEAGTTSYAYDDVGNLRFSQTSEQASKNLLTFNEYDDLRRVTLIGQAVIARQDCRPFSEDSLDAPCSPILSSVRLTDVYDPTKLHIGTKGTGLPVTANPTLLLAPSVNRTFHVVGNTINAKLSMCTLSPHPLLGETTTPPIPMVEHPAQKYVFPSTAAQASDFEDMSQHTEFARVAISYDKLPMRVGAIWANYPPPAVWHGLAPTGSVRNLKGREAAIAYRERGSEPFHYTVMSYDERGRVEAILRCNENLGFDAVYYTYNSMNLVKSVTVADPIRQHTTWYGYDHNGRIDTVWTALGAVGTGLTVPPPGGGNAMQAVHYPTPLQRPATPDIIYGYTKTNQIARMNYPPVNTQVDYTYNHRKFIDSIVAAQNGGGTTSTIIFKEALTYDSSGQIVQQLAKLNGTTETQRYNYDNVNRLTRWSENAVAGFDTTHYTYDATGNRTSRVWSKYPNSESYTLNGNQLEQRKRLNPEYGDTLRKYQYDLDGNATNRKVQLDSSTGAWTGRTAKPTGTGTLMSEDDRFSYRGLLNRVWHVEPTTLFDWRYRYSASGEREQKRIYYMAGTNEDSAAFYPWVYYLLGGNNQQLAVYHGQQTSSRTACGDTGRRVYMYPTEYLTYGANGIMSVTTGPNGAKQYKIADHLGSTRLMLGGSAPTNYDPFGANDAVTGDRKGYIDKEKDKETSLHNLGVRAYDDDEGRFLSIDPHWETYPQWSPYHYGMDNPLMLSDRTGLDTNSSQAPGDSRTNEFTNGLLGAIGGGIAVVGGVIALASGGGAPAGIAAIALGIPALGCNIAKMIDACQREDNQPAATIPGGVGEAVGYSVGKQYFGQENAVYFQAAGGLIEAWRTGGFKAVSLGEEYKTGEYVRTLSSFSITAATTAMTAGDVAYAVQHPPVTAAPASNTAHSSYGVLRVYHKQMGPPSPPSIPVLGILPRVTAGAIR